MTHDHTDQPWNKLGNKPGVIGATILCHSGFYFDFTDPHGSEILIDDIAWGLSNTARFAGQTKFYSVAQHCVHAARIVPQEHAFAALMHDASEAYTGDVPSPLKRILPDFKAIEHKIENAIAQRFGLPRELHPDVKVADYRMLRTERRTLLPGREDWPGMEQFEFVADHAVLGGLLSPWDPEEARHVWLTHFHALRPRG